MYTVVEMRQRLGKTKLFRSVANGIRIRTVSTYNLALYTLSYHAPQGETKFK